MRRAGDIISALFREKFGPGFMEAARTSADLFSSWARVVEEAWPGSFDEEQGKRVTPAAAVHSRIRELEQGLLLVEADHPGWIQILQTKQVELLSAVQRRHPDLGIRGITFRLSREPFVPPEPAPARKAPPASAHLSNDQTGRRRTEGKGAPEDEEFQALLKRLEESVNQRNN